MEPFAARARAAGARTVEIPNREVESDPRAEVILHAQPTRPAYSPTGGHELGVAVRNAQARLPAGGTRAGDRIGPEQSLRGAQHEVGGDRVHEERASDSLGPWESLVSPQELDTSEAGLCPEILPE